MKLIDQLKELGGMWSLHVQIGATNAM